MNNLRKQSKVGNELNLVGKLFNWLIFLLLIILIISLTRNIYRMKNATKNIDEANMRLKELESVNKNLTNELEYVSSDVYLEKEARNKLGLAKEDEIVLVLPEDEILRRLAPNYETSEEKLPDPNWKKWWEMFN